MNRKKCRNCGQYFRPNKPLQHYCLKPECVEEWVRVAREKQWKQRKAKLKEELKTVQDWTKEAQKVFNEWIRLRDKDKGCISCGKPLTDKYDAGHFFSSGGHKAITFHVWNVSGQCVECNRHKHGNLIEYRKGLIKRYGVGAMQQLEMLANDTRKYTVEELKEIIYIYKQKIKEWKTK